MRYTTLLPLLALLLTTMIFAQSNAVPYIDSPLVPTSTKPGGTEFTLTVNGVGFVSGSVKNWNGSPRATRFIGKTQLTAAILATDVNIRKTASITVSNPIPGGGISNVVFFPVVNQEPAVGLGTQTNCTTPPAATADFNGDGILDLAIFGPGNKVSILLGRGNATFETAASYTTPSTPMSAATGDFNRDGILDLAVVNLLTQNVGIYLGNGNGTFKSAGTFAVGATPSSIAVGDFNEDGNLDLVVAGDTVSILLGNGDGTFQRQVEIDSLGPFLVNVGDFNNDGHLDVALSDFSNWVLTRFIRSRRVCSTAARDVGSAVILCVSSASRTTAKG